MRTTIEISDGVFRKLKAVAALRGVSLRDFVTKAIEHELQGSPVRLDRTRVDLPIVFCKKPGAVKITPEKIAALLEAEDLHVPG